VKVCYRRQAELIPFVSHKEITENSTDILPTAVQSMCLSKEPHGVPIPEELFDKVAPARAGISRVSWFRYQ
jgi:hypothetical protein